MPNPVVAVRIPPELHAKLTERAEQEGGTLSDVARQILTEHFSPETTSVGPALSNPRTKLRPVPLRRS